MGPDKQPKSSSHPTALDVSSDLDAGMNLENFLLEEYKHGSAFVMQVLQDITASLNLYFLLLAIFVSGLGVAYQSNLLTKSNYILEPVLIVFLFTYGVIHFFLFCSFHQLRLRLS